MMTKTLPSEVNVYFPKPYGIQRDIIASTAKRRVIKTGRRVGKTLTNGRLAVERALSGGRVLESAPVYGQTEAFWQYVKTICRDLITARVVEKRETERVIEFPTGGRIRSKTAWDADSLRGDNADLLILDEFAMMNPSAWLEVGAPMLLDRDGDAIFTSTPRRKNHFYTMCLKAQQDTTGRWAVFQATTYDNPHLSSDALRDITQDMTEEMVRQELMAEFLDSEGAVFRNIAACMGAPITIPDEHKGHRIIAGIDWGKQADFTVISIGCQTCRKEVARDRFNQIDYAFQRGRLKELYDKWTPAVIVAESNAMGEPIIEQLQRDGLPVRGFATTATSKPMLIENLALALERGEWQWQADALWQMELEAYERTVSPQTGRSRYNAPEGVHDDTVIARALMLRAIGNAVEIVDNPWD